MKGIFPCFAIDLFFYGCRIRWLLSTVLGKFKRTTFRVALHMTC